MTTQKLGTKIHTETDFAVTALVMGIDGDSRLLIACELLGKNPQNYAHLDKGRRSMTGANLLRGAARKDASFVAKVRAAVEDGMATTGAEFFSLMDDKAVEQEIALDWPKSARFKFAQQQADGSFKFFYSQPKTGEFITR